MKTKRPDFATSNSYSTIITRGMQQKVGKITHEVDKIIALNGNDLNAIEAVDNCLILKGELESIPAFAHPLIYDDKVLIDARAYVNKEGQIKDLSEFHLLRRRANLELAWVNDTVDFGSQADLVVDVFATWFANGLTRRMNMSMVENNQLRILAAIYYLHFLHRAEGLSDEETAITLLKVLPRILRVPAPLVDEILGALDKEHITALYGYKGEQTPGSSVYLELMLELFNTLTDHSFKLTTPIVFNSLTRGAFISANSPELAAISIEHPPAFMLMIWYAMQKGIHGKTSIGLAASAVTRKHNEDKFNQFMGQTML